ncbi:MAG TPA: DUF4743 domain-containing protein [Candidatus Competibacteraceae bacterium]|nr:DUF4743 domain-containing protein [Candidatus Competibacteraceae bacterium]
MSFLDRVREANRHDPAHFRPFYVAGQHLGFVKHGFAETLSRWPEVFRVNSQGVWLHQDLDRAPDPVAARSAALRAVLAELRAAGRVPGWRDEEYPINAAFHEAPLLTLERAAVPLFGVPGYGVHLNGYVCRGDELYLWVGKRSMSKPTDPGKLDQVVAGGQPVGLGLFDNMVKECQEEAGIPEVLARRVRPVGAIGYCLETEQGLRPDVIYCFDLELPEDFTPVNVDGEVEGFYLWPIEQVIETVRDSDAFKFNCALVVIDFLIRHGCIAPEHPEYLALQAGLRDRGLWSRALGRA